MFAEVYKGKKVLVTGHTGFKGSWLSLWLKKLGAEVHGFSSYVPSEPSHYDVINLKGMMSETKGDIRNYETVQKAFHDFKPDIVFHLAAQPIVRTAYEEPKLTFDTNLGGTVNLLDAVKNSTSVQSAVFITSDKVYENVEWEFGYREPDLLGGKDPYSASKACAEIAFSAYMRSYFSQKDCNTFLTTARAGNVIGGGDWARDRIVPDCVRSWFKGEATRIRSPRATRPWQHVLEPLSGYLWLGALLYKKEAKLTGSPFNFGPKAEINKSVEDLITEMQKTWNSAQWINDQDPKEVGKEAGLLKLNCDRANLRLRWNAILSFEETAAFTANWYLKYFKESASAKELSLAQIDEYCALAAKRNQIWVE